MSCCVMRTTPCTIRGSAPSRSAKRKTMPTPFPRWAMWRRPAPSVRKRTWRLTSSSSLPRRTRTLTPSFPPSGATSAATTIITASQMPKRRRARTTPSSTGQRPLRPAVRPTAHRERPSSSTARFTATPARSCCGLIRRPARYWPAERCRAARPSPSRLRRMPRV